ncbi:t5orf172 domain-containing protein [Rhizoctonia solani AG-1 IA]|uniref:T5orf172 domain-containing protein n=1 Tax=Thanatephorus cucumeris (strain AG1-IA) TaxID=983506 RepID=L8X4G4_THACA|nr:t5orf172 domain-containing protein [Rhizoctonia solani AG-1 IA]
MSNPDQAQYEDVADAFKSLKVSSRAKLVAEDGKTKEKELPPIPTPPQRTPYKPRYPAHRRSSDDTLPTSLRPNILSSTVYPPPISMPTPHTGYSTGDPLTTNPLPRPPVLHHVLAGNVPPTTPPRQSNSYVPPRYMSMPRPDVPPSDFSMPGTILDPVSPPSRVPWPPPLATPYRLSNDPYLNGFSTPQPPRPQPISPPPKGSGNKPSQPRAASVPPDDKVPDTQCSAITKAGKRCTRQVKSGPALVYQSPGVLLDRFCFQHTKDVLQPTGFYSHAKVNTWVTFIDWIPNYLQQDTQAALRAEMEKPASASDKDGYIYAYEIRSTCHYTIIGDDQLVFIDPNTPDEVHIKVGRAVNLVKRLDEWGKQCVSREVIIRGWWPGTIEENDQDDSSNPVSLLKGKINPGEKGKYCHRLESACYFTLAGQTPEILRTRIDPSRAVRCCAEFYAKAEDDSSSSKTPSSSKLVKKPCPDCELRTTDRLDPIRCSLVTPTVGGAVHKEIFTLGRVTSGKMKGREWEDVVQPIIEKWGKFVTEYV